MFIGAAKQNFSSKNCTKKMIEDELTIWFNNARDRGKGGRKHKQHCDIMAATAAHLEN